jgi:hypothetical protein
MKLIVITCLKEYLEDISGIFKQVNINIFSTCDITGYKLTAPLHLLENWFASGGEEADSIMIFSFTDEANASQGMDLIKDYNKSLTVRFPIRVFVLPVEKFI